MSHPHYSQPSPHQHQQQEQQHATGMAYDIAPEPTMPGVRCAQDQYGMYYYDAPIPGIIDDNTFTFRTWQPHTKYMYFSDPAKNKNRGQVIYIKPWKGAREPPRVQCVDLTHDIAMRAPFGLRGVTTVNGETMGSNERPNLELSFDNADELEAFFRGIDDNIKAVASARLTEWFGVEPSMAPLVMKGYKPIVAVPKPTPGVPDKGYRPTMRVKLSLYGNDKRDTIVWAATLMPDGSYGMRQVTNRDEIDALLCKNARVIPIVDVSSLWFMQGFSWGTSLQMAEVVVMPQEGRQRGVFHGMRISTNSDQSPQSMEGAEGGSPSGSNASPTSHGFHHHQGPEAPMDVVGEGFGHSGDQYPAFDGHA